MIKVCEQCLMAFNTKVSRRKFCSKQCFWISKRGETYYYKDCKYCHKEFKSLRKNKLFCDTSCANKSRGTKFTKKCLICNNKFTTVPSQVKLGGGKYCSTHCSDIGHRKDNEFVKDRRKTVVYKEWRLDVFARDNWTCQKCLIRGGALEAHHIYSYARYDELRTTQCNGITLCKKCHSDFHKKFGINKFKPEDTYTFLA